MTQKAQEAEPAPAGGETAKASGRGLASRLPAQESSRLTSGFEAWSAGLQQRDDILNKKVEKATHGLSRLYEAGKAISTSLSRQSTLDVVVAQAARLTS